MVPALVEGGIFYTIDVVGKMVRLKFTTGFSDKTLCFGVTGRSSPVIGMLIRTLCSNFRGSLRLRLQAIESRFYLLLLLCTLHMKPR